MRILQTLVWLSVILVLTGCQRTAIVQADNPSTHGSAAVGDLVVSATIERLPEAEQFRTRLVIERVDAEGARSVLTAPTVVSLAGQKAWISLSDETNSIEAEVYIPPDIAADHGADINVAIRYEDFVVAQPKLRLPVPAATDAPGLPDTVHAISRPAL
ncbi:MAG: hypothetical protein OER86_11415 [Phycisphaerae bacterium]|nr:hypothetical protein [Phycisphaerae bacterium]